MREIKFRDFCLDKKEIRYFDLEHYDKNEHDCYGNIMQFTGLKDKNGTDIYEGDIVNKKLKEDMKWSTGYFEYGTGNMVKTGDYYMETTSVVSFQNGCFGHLHSNEVFHAPFNDDFEHEVLGNIYEHPHLIEKQKA